MSIYGQSIIAKDPMVLAYESATLCSYESLLESMIDSQYFFESIIDHAEFDQYIMNEAGENGKGKFDIKAAFDTLIEKIKEMFNRFVGWVKTTIEDFKRKIREWYEKHNIQKGLLKVAMAGFSYKDIEAAQEKIDNYEKYAKDNNEDSNFIKDVKDLNFPQGIDDLWLNSTGITGYVQKEGIEKLFRKELNDIKSRINKITEMAAGDAKDEYEKVSKNISELKDKINKYATNKDTHSLGNEKKKEIK